MNYRLLIIGKDGNNMSMSEETARKKVGRPLSPRTLEEIEALNPFPEPKPGFNPYGNWKHLYRIWLNHGYYGLLNLDAGYLRLERKKTDEPGRFILSVEQKSINWEGIEGTIKADIVCYNDSIAALHSWTYSSTFTDPQGTVLPELSVSHKMDFKEGNLIQEINGNRYTRHSGPLTTFMTSDWGLFEAVQRLPFDRSAHAEFDVYEGLTVLKKNHRLKCREKHNDSFKNLDIPLSGFVQMGDGVLPYEYWLDRHHRLLMAISGDRLYILDDNAGETYNAEVARHRGGEFSWQNKL